MTELDWKKDFSQKFNSGISHTFIVSGNIADYVAGDTAQSMRTFFVQSFMNNRPGSQTPLFDIVVVYSRSGGFWFPLKTMTDKFLELVGLATAATAGGMAGAVNANNQAGAELLAQAASQPAVALKLITKALAYRNAENPAKQARIAVLIEHAETLAPAGDINAGSEADRTALTVLMDWGGDSLLGAKDNLALRNHCCVLLVRDANALAEPLLRAGWETIAVGLPDTAARLEFINDLAATTNEQPALAELAEGVTAEIVARLTTGLTYRGIEDIFMRARYQNQPVSVAHVKARKDELISAEFNEVLKVIDSDRGFDTLGGLELVKTFLMDNVIIPMHNGHLDLVPQGVLLMGPAGTGKSKIALALAKEAGVTFVELQPSKILSKWVGDSERNLDRALSAIKSMTPCIVFIDEIDQSMARGESGDSGVGNRFFKRLMEFMADTTQRGHVLFVAATNRPDLLDAALKREGRFDVKIPILAPTQNERAEILQILTLAKLGQGLEIHELIPLAGLMEGYTGAVIESIVTKALRIFGRGTMSALEALTSAFELILPSTTDTVWMTRLALATCSDLELVPVAYRAEVRTLRARAEADETPEELKPSRRKAGNIEF